ncbi:hypothetical protein PTKIN_Ptkin08bG0206000 [Pterospermum kingtungense]
MLIWLLRAGEKLGYVLRILQPLADAADDFKNCFSQVLACLDTMQVGKFVTVLWSLWKAPISEQEWVRPPAGFLKCNVDAAVFNHDSVAGLGMALRNEFGQFVAAKTVSIAARISAREAEASAVDWVSCNCNENSEFGCIVEACRSRLAFEPALKVAYIRRLANELAHVLAF